LIFFAKLDIQNPKTMKIIKLNIGKHSFQ